MISLFNREPDILTLHTVDATLQEEREHLERLKRRWDRYSGKFPRPLKVPENQPDDNVAVNKCRVIIDTGVHFLFGREVTFELEEGTTTPEEQALIDFWQANRKMTLLHKLGINGGYGGHVFVLLEPASPLTDGQPRLILLDPSEVAPVFRHNDIGDVYKWRIQYNGVDDRTGKPAIFRKRIERAEAGTSWHITDEMRLLGARTDRWTLLGEAGWPYPWAPLFHAQNLPNPNEFWGRSDIEDDLIHLNEVINLNLSLLQRTLVHHGYPRMYASGIGEGTLELGADKIVRLPSGGVLGAVEMRSDGAASLDTDRRLNEYLHQLAAVPEVATGKLESIGNLSGTALRVLYRPLIDRTESKRLTYGDLLTEINRRVLDLLGHGPDNIAAVKWQEVVPTDPLEQMQAAVLKQQFGYSDDTLIQQTGGDPDLERAKRAQSDAGFADAAMATFDRGQTGNMPVATPSALTGNGGQP